MKMNKILLDTLSASHDKWEIIEQFLDNKSLHLEIIYESKFTNTKYLRDFIEVIMEKLGFSKREVSRMILVSDELNNNAIEYGSNPEGKNILRILTEEKEGNLHFCMEIQDNGKGKAPKTALDMETLRAHKLKRWYFNHNSIRGRGLFLITVQIADRLYFKNAKDGGLIVGIKKIMDEKELETK